MKNKPIVVVGPGRCGSSVIAGMLFHLGVHMGDWFIKADSHNPTGYWEDAEIGLHNSMALSGEMTEEEWVEGMQELIKRREGHEWWGFKDPAICHTIEEFKKLGDFTYIYCDRDTKELIKEARKIWGWSRRVAEKTIEERVENVKKHLPARALILDFNNIIDMVEAMKTVDTLIRFIGLKPTPKQRRRATELVLAPDNKNRLIAVNSRVYKHND